jgi:hypothetical protein
VSRETYVLRDGKLVPKSQAAPLRSSGPYVQSDNLPGGALRHPATGKLMDSKSQFRDVTRAHGCVEVGNETQRDTRRIEMPNLKADIGRAITQLGG